MAWHCSGSQRTLELISIISDCFLDHFVDYIADDALANHVQDMCIRFAVKGRDFGAGCRCVHTTKVWRSASGWESLDGSKLDRG